MLPRFRVPEVLGLPRGGGWRTGRAGAALHGSTQDVQSQENGNRREGTRARRTQASSLGLESSARELQPIPR